MFSVKVLYISFIENNTKKVLFMFSNVKIIMPLHEDGRLYLVG